MVIYLFILRERQRDNMSRAEAEREGRRESQTGSVLTAQSLMWSLIPQIMRPWPELKSRVGCLTTWATQAPLRFYFLSTLSIQRGAPTHNLKIKNPTLHWLSHPRHPGALYVKCQVFHKNLRPTNEKVWLIHRKKENPKLYMKQCKTCLWGSPDTGLTRQRLSINCLKYIQIT